jgi:hypothetical protein
MKTKILFTAVLSGLIIFSSCKKALDYTPKGVLSASDLKTPIAVEGLVTAAYAAIGNGDMIGPIYSDWAYGSVRQMMPIKAAVAPGMLARLMLWSITTW